MKIQFKDIDTRWSKAIDKSIKLKSIRWLWFVGIVCFVAWSIYYIYSACSQSSKVYVAILSWVMTVYIWVLPVLFFLAIHRFMGTNWDRKSMTIKRGFVILLTILAFLIFVNLVVIMITKMHVSSLLK